MWPHSGISEDMQTQRLTKVKKYVTPNVLVLFFAVIVIVDAI
jgi:hypothetical protein